MSEPTKRTYKLQKGARYAQTSLRVIGRKVDAHDMRELSRSSVLEAGYRLAYSVRSLGHVYARVVWWGGRALRRRIRTPSSDRPKTRSPEAVTASWCAE